ncbi:MAG: IS200/IS605 family transposase [Candidatus Firestonebacteria bacterium]
MSKYIHKRHNVSKLLYHFVCPVKYRRIVITDKIDKTLKELCIEISKRYEMNFVEIGADNDHVHFLIQSVPNISASKIIMIVKSIIAKEIFQCHPEIMESLWGGSFWTAGFFVNTVGASGNEEVIRNYVKGPGLDYKKIYRDQMKLF